MGTRVALNAIVWVPTIVGHYSSPILRTSDKLDNGPATTCVPIIPQEQASQNFLKWKVCTNPFLSPIHLLENIISTRAFDLGFVVISREGLDIR